MKSKYLLIALLAFGGALSAQADTLPAGSKDAKPSIISVKTASTTASSTSKAAKKGQDPIISLMEMLASSIDKTNIQIDTLQKQGADTAAAEGLIFDAKLHLHSVELSLNPDASSTATTTTEASSTPTEIKKAKDDLRKEAVDSLKIAYADILNAIIELKKTILAQREALDGTPADTDTVTEETPQAASDAATSTAATSTPLTDNPTAAN